MKAQMVLKDWISKILKEIYFLIAFHKILFLPLANHLFKNPEKMRILEAYSLCENHKR